MCGVNACSSSSGTCTFTGRKEGEHSSQVCVPPLPRTFIRKLRILDGVEFIEAPTFTAMVRDYLEDDEYRALQLFLAGDPEAGDVMLGTGGFRKLRWADRRRGKRQAWWPQGDLLLPLGRCSDLADDALRQGRNGRPERR